MHKEEANKPIEVRIFGSLRKHMDRQDLPYMLKKEIPEGKLTPIDIAGELDIPIDEIEAVFINGKVSDKEGILSPGDRIGFLPYGTPGPYRLFLGMVEKKNQVNKA
jgi:hypothetical protein